MRTRRTWLFYKCLLLLTLLFFIEYGDVQAVQASLTLVYTSNTLGTVEPCGTCPESGNAGGLARRAHYFKTVRQEAKNLLVLDGGDALAVTYSSEPKRREQARKRAELVLKLYETLGYDALNIGDTDLGLGIGYLRNLQKKSKVPFLSANLKERKTGRTVFKPYLIKEVEGLKIGIVGLVTAEVSVGVQKELKSYSIEDPIETATVTIQRFLASCDHIIALVHLTPSEIESLTREVPRISILIGGNDRFFTFPRQIGRTLYIQTDAFGAHVGRLNLNLSKGFDEFADILSGRLIQKKIEEIQGKMKDPNHTRDHQGLKELQDILIEQKRKIPSPEGKNTYENYFTLMHPGMKSDPEVQRMIDSSRDRKR